MAIAFTSKKKTKKKDGRRQALTGKVALNMAIKKAEKEFKTNPSNDASIRGDIFRMQEVLTNLKNQALVYKSLVLFAVRALDFYDGSSEERTKKEKAPLDQIRELRKLDMAVDDLTNDCDDMNVKTTQALKCKSIPELASYFSDTMITGFDNLQEKFTQIYFTAQSIFPQYLEGIKAQSEHAANFVRRNFVKNVPDKQDENLELDISDREMNILSQNVISDMNDCCKEKKVQTNDQNEICEAREPVDEVQTV